MNDTNVPKKPHSLIAHIYKLGCPPLMLRFHRHSRPFWLSIEFGHIRLNICQELLRAVANIEFHRVEGRVVGKVGIGGGAFLGRRNELWPLVCVVDWKDEEDEKYE